MSDYPRAKIVGSTPDGKLDDPDARALFQAIALDPHMARVHHFRRRATERGLAPADTLVVVLNGNEPVGSAIAALLMPDGWEAPHRASDAVPYARGLADRAELTDAIATIAPDVAAALRAVEGAALLVADCGTLVAFKCPEAP